MIKSLENIIYGERIEPNLAYQREGYKTVTLEVLAGGIETLSKGFFWDGGRWSKKGH